MLSFHMSYLTARFQFNIHVFVLVLEHWQPVKVYRHLFLQAFTGSGKFTHNLTILVSQKCQNNLNLKRHSNRLISYLSLSKRHYKCKGTRERPDCSEETSLVLQTLKLRRRNRHPEGDCGKWLCRQRCKRVSKVTQCLLPSPCQTLGEAILMPPSVGPLKLCCCLQPDMPTVYITTLKGRSEFIHRKAQPSHQQYL